MFKKILDFLLSLVVYVDESIDDITNEIFLIFCKDFKKCLNTSICSSTRVEECDSYDIEKKELYLHYKENIGEVNRYCTEFWAMPAGLSDINKYINKYKNCKNIKEVAVYPTDKNNRIWFVDVWYKKYEIRFKLIPNNWRHHKEATLKFIEMKRRVK